MQKDLFEIIKQSLNLVETNFEKTNNISSPHIFYFTAHFAEKQELY